MTIEDREAIRELLHRSCLYADAADTEGWLSLYAEDGSLDMGMGDPPMRGADALRAFASKRTPGNRLHVSSNAVIDVDGDRARATSYVVVIGDPDDPRVRLAGRYDDELRRVDGQWRFVTRRLQPQFQLRS